MYFCAVGLVRRLQSRGGSQPGGSFVARVASEAGVIHQPHHHFGLHRRSAGGDDQAASPFALLIEGTDTPARQPAAKDDGPPPSSTSAAAETRTTSGEATDKTKANLDGALEAAIVTGDQTAELPVQPVAAGGLTQTGDVTNAQCADVIAASEQLG